MYILKCKLKLRYDFRYFDYLHIEIWVMKTFYIFLILFFYNLRWLIKKSCIIFIWMSLEREIIFYDV